MINRLQLFGLLASLFLVLLTVPVGRAQAPERIEAFVYGTTYYNGLVYDSGMVPPGTGTIYFTAGVQNILAPRRTLIYYWPITNRFLADWDAMNELVQGQLEIYQNGQILISVPLQEYVIQYDRQNPVETLNLFVGDQAFAEYQKFEQLRAEYRQTLFDYYAAHQKYRDEMDEILRSHKPGEVNPEELPQRPGPAPNFNLLSTQPNKAYALSLPVGSYEIQIRLEDGRVLESSRKKLVVFDRLREGVAYSVVPQARWNRPEESTHPNGVIYALFGSRLYLLPSRESEYNEFLYTRMTEPQDQSARRDRTKWVVHNSYPASLLRVRKNNRTVEEIPLRPYFVQQLPGGALGYEVIEFDLETMERASFEGFQIDLNTFNSTYVIELLDGDNNPIPGSQRELRVLYTDRGWMVYVLSSLPFLAGLVVFFSRRKNLRQIDLLTEE